MRGRAKVGILVAVLAAAAALRLPGLDRVPPALFCDEASAGYDAWCLLETGRDQYGTLLPLYARSFGDHDEALMRYLTVPFVAALGLTEIAVRLPAALAGILSVLLAFLLGRADLAAMRQGAVDPAGRTQTLVAMWLGLAGAAVYGVVLIVGASFLGFVLLRLVQDG